MSETTVAEQATAQPRAGKRARMPKGVQGTQQPAEGSTNPDGPQADDGAPSAPQTGPQPADGQAAIDQAKAQTEATAKRSAEAKAEEAKAKAEPKPKQAAYLDAKSETVIAIAAGIAAARKSGLSRKVLAAELPPGRNLAWRAENARVRSDEVEPLQKLLKRIASGELQPPARLTTGPKASAVTKAVLADRLRSVTDFLETARETRSLKSRAEVLAVINEALLLADPPQSSQT